MYKNLLSMKAVMSFALLIFASIADFLVVMSTIFFVIIFAVPRLISILIHGLRKEDKPTKKISKQDIITLVGTWSDQHKNQIKNINRVDSADGSVTFTIEPLAETATIVLDIGWELAFSVSINGYMIGFDHDCEDFYPLDEKTVYQLLFSYAEGNYYIKDYFIGSYLVDSYLYFTLDKETEVTGRINGASGVRRSFAKTKIATFLPLDGVSCATHAEV